MITIKGRSLQSVWKKRIEGWETLEEMTHVSKFFDRIYHHNGMNTRDERGEVVGLYPKSAYFYAGPIPFINNARTKIEIPYVSGACYEIIGESKRGTITGAENKITFYTTINDNDQIIAQFDKENKYLNACDIPHTNKGWEVLKPILDYLVENGHLVERKDEEVVYRVSIGCDPEFEIVDLNGSVIAPRNEDGRRRSYLSSIGWGNLTDPGTQIGLDGAGAQLELRPKASLNPDEVINNLKKLFGKIDFHLSVKGDKYPLGGHIHFGMGSPYTPHSELLQLLDYFIGEPTLKLSGTSRAGYATRSAYEEKRWGFEYRTPPAAIFLDPLICRITLKIAKAVVEKYVNGGTFTIQTGEKRAEYLELGITEAEYSFWKDFPSRYKKVSYKKNVAAYWHRDKRHEVLYHLYNKVVKKNVKLDFTPANASSPDDPIMGRASDHVVFRDDWCSDAEEMVHRKMRNYLTKKQIILFGIREDRGLITTIPGSNIEFTARISIQNFADSLSGDRAIAYGVPWLLRVVNRNEYRDQLGNLIDALIVSLVAANILVREDV